MWDSAMRSDETRARMYVAACGHSAVEKHARYCPLSAPCSLFSRSRCVCLVQGPDDRPEDDPENPPRDRDRGEDPLAKLQSSAAADAQAQQRAAFRASMRAKYLKKG